jgi:hypothetical protein
MVALKLFGAVLAGALFRCRRGRPLLHTPLTSGGSQNSTSTPLWGPYFRHQPPSLQI